MTEQQKADAIANLGSAIFAAIQASPGGDDIPVIIGALGVVVGATAKASGDWQGALSRVLDVANGVISGALLD